MGDGGDRTLEEDVLEYESKLDTADYFTLLGVVRNADAAEVKRAFYKLSRRFHPDRHFREPLGPLKPRLLKVFRALSRAHQTLTSPELRAAYLEANPHLKPPKVVATKHNKRLSWNMADLNLAPPPGGDKPKK